DIISTVGPTAYNNRMMRSAPRSLWSLRCSAARTLTPFVRIRHSLEYLKVPDRTVRRQMLRLVHTLR
ncbi:MAG: hypothetical protein K8S54_21325, partial [Spirochaetia bacterium]|nr:hypothetical protein [Spirochaetia bacterium]